MLGLWECLKILISECKGTRAADILWNLGSFLVGVSKRKDREIKIVPLGE